MLFFRGILLSLGLIMLAGSSFAATCLPSAKICLDLSCRTLGSSVMDHDNKNIITCLKNDSGNLVWKGGASSSTEGTVSIIGVCSSIGVWTLSNLIANKPVYIGVKAGSGSSIFTFKIISGALTGASDENYFRIRNGGASDSVKRTTTPSAVIIPTATVLKIHVVSLKSANVYAYQ